MKIVQTYVIVNMSVNAWMGSAGTNVKRRMGKINARMLTLSAKTEVKYAKKYGNSLEIPSKTHLFKELKA